MAPSHPWRYERDAGTGIEVAQWRGDSAPALAGHFHAEAQVTCVLSGSRLFQVGGQTLRVAAGEWLVIPPGVPHRSLVHADPGTECINLYLPVEGLDGAAPGASLRNADDAVADSVTRLAERAGLSREAFTRRFARHAGLPPAAYRLVERLNLARQQLRCGAALADVAADLGFADQSHLGRRFKKAFGIAPAAYRAGMRRSQTF